MTNKQMAKMINESATSARKSFAQTAPTGSKIIDINYGLPYVAVNCPDGSEYFFQEQEASDLLAEAVETGNKFNVSVENAIIWKSQSW